ncbi:hypothetical protein TWF192_005142 [Orbilia oligospora]|uniref:Uncharacterized protein n=1 Tax=Orbilia oligospora TaxID=2813651 RepID=A0A6G1M9B5_ORBOL|nr:hypothetical protein TWF679_004205 [Orbilia oligospora]KAF3226666.1 hypothetical protein TWF191_004489 [Orbilia oligospora]KAF3250703.1 hypothetical protein TWF192_005142 [Orbilia oligospora]
MRHSTVLAFIGLLLSVASAAPVGEAFSPSEVIAASSNIHLPRAPEPATTTAAVIPPTDFNVEFFDIPLKQAISPNKRNVERLFKRGATCYDPDYYTFNTSDFWAMENSFWPRTDWLYVEHLKVGTWTWGTVRICFANYYLFANTNVYVRNFGDAMAVIGGCCTGSRCAGGSTTVTGDNGVNLSVWVTQSARGCFT